MELSVVVCSLSASVGSYFVLRRLWRAKTTSNWNSVISPWFAVQVAVLCIAVQTLLNLQAMLGQANSTFNPYAILEIPLDADKEMVMQAWDKSVELYHPDKPTSDPDKFLLMQKAFEALTDPVGMKNFEDFGHPDGPLRDFNIFMALPSWIKPGIFLQIARLAGYLCLAFFGFGIFAWWRNRVHEREKHKAIGVTPEDLEAIENAMSGEETVEEMLHVVMACPCLVRSLRNLRQHVIESNIKVSGKVLAEVMQRERDAETEDAFVYLTTRLEALGDWPSPMREVDADEDGANVLESEELLRDHVVLLVLTLFRRNDPKCPELQEQRLQEELTNAPTTRELNLMKHLVAGLLDQILLRICARRRWLIATHSSLRLTALFAAGLRKDDAEGKEYQTQRLEAAGEPVPQIQVRGELEGGTGPITAGDILTLKISCERTHHTCYGPEDVALTPKDIREAYWIIMEMSNGEKTLLASLAPLLVKQLADPVVSHALQMKAPVTAGKYTLTLVLRSPTVVGLVSSCTISFTTHDEEAEESSSDEDDGIPCLD